MCWEEKKGSRWNRVVLRQWKKAKICGTCHLVTPFTIHEIFKCFYLKLVTLGEIDNTVVDFSN
jgi:hypothetical protein